MDRSGLIASVNELVGVQLLQVLQFDEDRLGLRSKEGNWRVDYPVLVQEVRSWVVHSYVSYIVF